MKSKILLTRKEILSESTRLINQFDALLKAEMRRQVAAIPPEEIVKRIWSDYKVDNVFWNTVERLAKESGS